MQRNFLKTIVLMLSVAALTMSVPMLSAQDAMSNGNPDAKQEAMQKLEKMASALQLTPAQKKQVAPILMEEAPKLQALKTNTSMRPMQKAMQMRQIANDTDAKLKPILTPQQYQTWEQMREQERQQMMQKMENH